jgi:hypothetical protein
MATPLNCLWCSLLHGNRTRSGTSAPAGAYAPKESLVAFHLAPGALQQEFSCLPLVRRGRPCETRWLQITFKWRSTLRGGTPRPWRPRARQQDSVPDIGSSPSHARHPFSSLLSRSISHCACWTCFMCFMNSSIYFTI